MGGVLEILDEGEWDTKNDQILPTDQSHETGSNRVRGLFVSLCKPDSITNQRYGT